MSEGSQDSNPPKPPIEADVSLKSEFIMEPSPEPENLFEAIKENKEARTLLMYALYGENGVALWERMSIREVGLFMDQYKTGGEIATRLKPLLDNLHETRPDRYDAYREAERLLRQLR